MSAAAPKASRRDPDLGRCGVHTPALSRRDFLRLAGYLTGATLAAGSGAGSSQQTPAFIADAARTAPHGRRVTLFMCGDVMTGRGIDQVMRRSVHPQLYEPYITDARDYVRLAEARNGPIPAPVDAAYVWGDALAELDRAAPDVRIVNLETAVTAAGEPWPGKGIHYRMHPANTDALQAARIDCCVLANNHVLDWGYTGLAETTATLAAAGIRCAGVGADAAAADAPAVLPVAGGGRVLVFAMASTSSGVPRAWAATGERPGLRLIDESSAHSARAAAELVARHQRPGDIVVVSIHWGGNWGYRVPPEQTAFAHALLDTGLVDVLHGHSSHHPKGIEVYRGRLILYGCGDLLNDYEGIRGHEPYRGDLSLLYLPVLHADDGRLLELAMVPLQTRRLRLQRAGADDGRWLAKMLDREGRPFGSRVALDRNGHLHLGWD